MLPLEGEVTAIVRGANEVEWWGLAQDWVKLIRPSRRSYGEPVSERLKEIRAERAGVNFVTLERMPRDQSRDVPLPLEQTPRIRQAERKPSIRFALNARLASELRPNRAKELFFELEVHHA